MKCYKSGWVGGDGVDGGGGGAAGGRLYPPLRLFRLAMSPKSASHRSLDSLRDVSPPLGQFWIHAFHVVPCMGVIVSVITLHG